MKCPFIVQSIKSKYITLTHKATIYELVEFFKTEQAATQVTVRQLETGGVLAPTRKAHITKEKRLKTNQQKFINDEYSLEEYVTALRYWVGFRS